ncbi:hypothetical protein L7P61_11280 [Aeromonas veronii bv. sobria]|uniref:Uncharacterized protein n=1 Tax=Aeromonas veronii TaxID=654 RepID=A0ABY3MRL5_AERVE|nr:hypothetical protein [Aeromonas veronii]RDU86301.1 hypothetical protein CGZ72_10095 [Aeromonas veronii]RDU90158.1 hypothetical protein CGZ76_03375 [Aeromonas veronii]TEY52590.1 hypothetical protein CIG14_08760 [Aeromonas veronii]TEY79959.1 hypothetical protein CIG16_08760 [Aeromonas veronii]TYD47948.1 hypothetical protein CJF24_01030 [Aeromonas veronii]
MTNELPLSHTSRQWLGLVAAKAKLQPTRQGERWLLHLTLGRPHARTVTLHLSWSGGQWQLLSLTNAEDWRTMSQPVDEICVDPKRRCFWRCQAGPVSLIEQPRVLASFLADLQRTCTHHGYCVESDHLPQEEARDAQTSDSC